MCLKWNEFSTTSLFCCCCALKIISLFDLLVFALLLCHVTLLPFLSFCTVKATDIGTWNLWYQVNINVLLCCCKLNTCFYMNKHNIYLAIWGWASNQLSSQQHHLFGCCNENGICVCCIDFSLLLHHVYLESFFLSICTVKNRCRDLEPEVSSQTVSYIYMCLIWHQTRL